MTTLIWREKGSIYTMEESMSGNPNPYHLPHIKLHPFFLRNLSLVIRNDIQIKPKSGGKFKSKFKGGLVIFVSVVDCKFDKDLDWLFKFESNSFSLSSMV